jgi:hypothetical protein
MYAFSWHLRIRFHRFPSCQKRRVFFWGKFLSDTGRGTFVGVSSNRGTNIENSDTLLQKGHFWLDKGHFRPEGGCAPPGSAHDHATLQGHAVYAILKIVFANFHLPYLRVILKLTPFLFSVSSKIAGLKITAK